MNFEPLLLRCFSNECALTDVVALKGDASSRRYYRLVLKGRAAPETVIAMVLPDDPLKSDEAMGGDRPSELPFVDVGRHLDAKGLRVPKVYLDATDDAGVLLIEDLGDTQLVDIVRNQDEEQVTKWYDAAATLLGTLHQEMWPIPPTCIAARRSFDYNLLRWELDHFREWGIEAVWGPLDPDVRNMLDSAFDAFALDIAALPTGFVHRDFQSRNLMVLDAAPLPSSFGIIDFQDALIGPRVYDLVALLNDSYVTLSAAVKAHLIEIYAAKRGVDPDIVKAEFRRVTVQRKLKDGARFIFIDRVKHNPTYLEFVDTSFSRARESLNALQGHDALKAALEAADPNRFGGLR